jgi:1-deoxy-D-xylulose-5-phosphate synthase
MPGGTSTAIFQKAFPDRHFDVGIAEGHGVTFAAGLATQGVRPVVAIYSTFLQRGYDSIVHDVALQDLPVIFCMDRAGIAGEDGPTHHGAFDISYMLAVPGMTVTAPKDGSEMLALLRAAVAHESGPYSIRYPRDTVPEEVPALADIPPVAPGSWEILREGGDLAILAVGTMVRTALEAAAGLAEEGVEAAVVNCRYLKPYDRETLGRVLAEHRVVLTVEEGAVANGFGAFMGREIADDPGLPTPTCFGTHGIPDRFIDHGPRKVLLAELGLDPQGIQARVRALLGSARMGSDRRPGAPASTAGGAV